MPDIIITPSSGIIDFFPVSSRVGRIEGSGNTINIVNPSGFVAVSGSGLSINTSSPNATFHAYSATSGATILNIEGTNGSLFSVVDNLSGSLMSVNNNAGLPVFEVFSDDRVVAGRFGQNDFIMTSGGNIGIGTGVPSSKFHVVGSVLFSSGLSVSGLITSNSGNFINSLTVNSTGVSISGHTHTSSNITDFNSSVSGLLPTISNSGDNRVLTSTGSSLGINAESNLTFDGQNLSAPYLLATYASGDEGGEIQLAKPPSGTLAGGITIDAYQNRLRFFEQGGSARGFYLDVSSGGAGASTNLAGGGGSATTVSNYGDNRIITSDGTTAGLNAESNFTFNGSLLSVTGSGLFSGDIRTSGSFIGGSGTAALPSFEFVNDTDTGLFSPSGNIIGFATSGIERLRIDNLGRIGVGTNSPTSTLHVVGSGLFASGLAVTGLTISNSGNFINSLQLNGSGVGLYDTSVFNLGTISGSNAINCGQDRQIQTLTLNGVATTFTTGTGWPTSNSVARETTLNIFASGNTSVTWTIVNDWYRQPDSPLPSGRHIVLLRSVGSGTMQGYYIGNKTN
jgi:hypothetical protein